MLITNKSTLLSWDDVIDMFLSNKLLLTNSAQMSCFTSSLKSMHNILTVQDPYICKGDSGDEQYDLDNISAECNVEELEISEIEPKNRMKLEDAYLSEFSQDKSSYILSMNQSSQISQLCAGVLESNKNRILLGHSIINIEDDINFGSSPKFSPFWQ
jgi:hypothetical protein